MANGIRPREAHGHRSARVARATPSHPQEMGVDGTRRLVVPLVGSRQITKSVNELGGRAGPPLEPVRGS